MTTSTTTIVRTTATCRTVLRTRPIRLADMAKTARRVPTPELSAAMAPVATHGPRVVAAARASGKAEEIAVAVVKGDARLNDSSPATRRNNLRTSCDGGLTGNDLEEDVDDCDDAV